LNTTTKSVVVSAQIRLLLSSLI